MSGEMLTGQDAPVVNGEATNTASATTPAETTSTQTDGGDGGAKDSPVSETVTLTKAELQDQIERATAKAAAKAERRAFREARDMLATQQQPQRPAQQAASDDGKPKREQFASEDDWLDARDDWRDRARETQSRQTRDAESARTIATKTEKLYAEAEKLPEFDRDAFDDAIRTPGLSAGTLRALIDSDMSAQLMAHFSSNAEDVERIAKFSPERQAAELGKLEVKLTQAKPPAKSNAPRALALVKGAGASGDMPDPSDTKAYIRWANQQERSARR